MWELKTPLKKTDLEKNKNATIVPDKNSHSLGRGRESCEEKKKNDDFAHTSTIINFCRFCPCRT